jgi:hypothetical protein
VKFMLLIYGDETWMDGLSEGEQAAHMRRWQAHSDELQEAGVVCDGAALQRTETATCVRGAQQPLVSDGPFAETREQLGGYYMLDVEHLDEAIAWAKKSPALVAGGTVELRPVIDM